MHRRFVTALAVLGTVAVAAGCGSSGSGGSDDGGTLFEDLDSSPLPTPPDDLVPLEVPAGTLVLRGEDGAPRASVFHIAHTKDGVKDPAERPVTFAFNGGPGSSSLGCCRRAASAARRIPNPVPAGELVKRCGCLSRRVTGAGSRQSS